jgi:hypothetical protein
MQSLIQTEWVDSIQKKSNFRFWAVRRNWNKSRNLFDRVKMLSIVWLCQSKFANTRTMETPQNFGGLYLTGQICASTGYVQAVAQAIDSQWQRRMSCNRKFTIVVQVITLGDWTGWMIHCSVPGWFGDMWYIRTVSNVYIQGRMSHNVACRQWWLALDMKGPTVWIDNKFQNDWRLHLQAMHIWFESHVIGRTWWKRPHGWFLNEQKDCNQKDNWGNTTRCHM